MQRRGNIKAAVSPSKGMPDAALQQNKAMDMLR